jgi:hypothetical protein
MANKYYKSTLEFGKFKTEYEEVKKTAERVTKNNAVIQKQVDKLADSVKTSDSIIKAQNKRTNVLIADRSKLKKDVADLERQLLDSTGTQITDTAQIIVIKDGIISKLKVDIVQADEIIKDKDKVISRAETQKQQLSKQVLLVTGQRDSLQLVVNGLPKAPRDPNKFLGIPLPSRSLSYVLGVASGLYAGYKLSSK